ncbi:hypothetical protein [Motilimonas cestriensis]|uniref:hypothetical protein n=1 Tax=Motilimonas cestriensis TaxID=2742685 RepID=UPI001E3F3C20|nr:hypothetical protein [Motilimonas cestriensis]
MLLRPAYIGTTSKPSDFEQPNTDNLYIEVATSSVTATPTEYVIEVIDNPYVGLNDYDEAVGFRQLCY